MGSVEAELWNIFTYYTLHGNALDPEHLALTQLVQLARDTQLLDGALVKTPLRKADIELVFIHEVKRRKSIVGSNSTSSSNTNIVEKLTYNEFLTCLMRLSQKLYPEAAELNIETAFQQLLMENVLPLASRRSPRSIDAILGDGEILGLKKYFRESLRYIFEFYGSSGLHSQRAKAGAKGTKGNVDFDATRNETNSRFANNKNMSPTGMSETSNRSSGLKNNSMSSSMSYADFVRFASDFGLNSKVLITMIDIGDIYMAGVANATGTASIRRLHFDDFFEVLVRISLASYKKCMVPHAMKLRGLLLFMWRQIQTNISASVNGKNVSSSRSSHKGGLLRGAQLYNERFIAMWQDDDYKDYLQPPQKAVPEGRDVLSTLMDEGDIKPPAPPVEGGGGGGGIGVSANKASAFHFELENDDDGEELKKLDIDPNKLKDLLIRRPDLAEMLQTHLLAGGC